jgi:formate hydrogenlyase subunit 6/NADH:ubiquinone oxidoreductase subunit I
MKKKRPSYLREVVSSLTAVLKGLKLTGKHYVKGYDREAPMGIADDNYFKKDQGPITIQYPMEKVAIPDVGRYRLFMETDDCIGCDKCARICPVDCITIETFRADGDLGRTTDGTMKRLHLPTFDIDMGKCMFCGLCTTVCPTECLTMTPVYDFSEYDRDNFVYHFGAYSPEDESLIRLATEASLAAKKAEKAAAIPPPTEVSDAPVKRRPMVQRGPAQEPKPEDASTPQEVTPPVPETPVTPKPRPMMRPVMKKAEDSSEQNTHPLEDSSTDKPVVDSPKEELVPPKPRPRPVMQRKPAESDEILNPTALTPPEEKKSSEEVPPSPPPTQEITEEEPPKPRPRARPVMRRPENTEGGAEA